jgi:hypothetical protein
MAMNSVAAHYADPTLCKTTSLFPDAGQLESYFSLKINHLTISQAAIPADSPWMSRQFLPTASVKPEHYAERSRSKLQHPMTARGWANPKRKNNRHITRAIPRVNVSLNIQCFKLRNYCNWKTARIEKEAMKRERPAVSWPIQSLLAQNGMPIASATDSIYRLLT